VPHSDPEARRLYQAAYQQFYRAKQDVEARRAYQRLHYSVNRDKMLARGAAYRQRKRTEALADVPPLTIDKGAFLDLYRAHRPQAPWRDAHALWRAATAISPSAAVAREATEISHQRPEDTST
jgi:hypothetical protein